MISLQVTGRHFEVDDKIAAYLDKKIGLLDKYLPKPSPVTHASVVLEFDKSGREANAHVCEVIFEVPGENLQAKEATANMYAAIDIVEQKLKMQCLKLKEKADPAKNRRRFSLGKLLHRREDDTISGS